MTYKVGDRVAFHYLDKVEPGTVARTQPVVSGVILELPTPTSRYYAIDVKAADIPDVPGVHASDEGDEFPHYAAPNEIVSVLPASLDREDIEAWLET